MKNTIIIFLVLVLVGIGAYFLFQSLQDSQDADTTTDETTDTTENGEQADKTEEDGVESVIGTSVQGREITAYHYGDGGTELLFVGGIHGGYSWNTVLVAYELMDYLEENPDVVPENVRVTIIPALNPDGLNKVVGTTSRFTQADVPMPTDETIPGRFNANDVDLNRNFDCDWSSTGTWRNITVSGGGEPFSEPESQALRDYVEAHEPDAVAVWYSAAGGVFASSCNNGVSSETRTITNVYADASGYKAYEDFDFYEVTGDMVNWFAKNNIPAISVLLTTHEDVEWDKNRAGIEALLEYYAE